MSHSRIRRARRSYFPVTYSEPPQDCQGPDGDCGAEQPTPPDPADPVAAARRRRVSAVEWIPESQALLRRDALRAARAEAEVRELQQALAAARTRLRGAVRGG